ncbi:ROK family protein [Altererythrobacter salegens]|uniref:fructokinase n=1 Tax=Croceibacterium salegens TaxID=1737568 RepID=A0A6I4T059_9SPHN|nr:ROK family protein [Croceibacterium salegens]MXO61009.1 ROK family protein [Croceibacterium salegens]
MPQAARLAGIELGGTKAIAVLSDGEQIISSHTVPTGAPGETLGALNEHLRRWHDQQPLAGIGIASFGPVALAPAHADFGHILDTTKPGWRGAGVVPLLMQGIDCPFRIDTDVNAAALAEYRRGAAQGCDSVCYITIGTGIGGGLLVGGQPVHGALHPELGHLKLRRVEGDTFAGACSFHGDCIEGLASGPALAARFGMPGEAIPGDHPGWANVAADLGQLAAAVLVAISADKIVFGGSVSLQRPYLLPLVREEAVRSVGGYLPHVNAETIRDLIVFAALGNQAGPMGAIELALMASLSGDPAQEG